eukprot:jgi/Picsp_1/2042/NSC_05507-R1_Os08g0192200 [Oryza sativa Japonica Group]
MDTDTLAELELLRDAARLSAKAREHGVSAYLGRRKPPRLNSAFLANTVCNVEQANRRVEENAMWAKRRVELGQEETSEKEDSSEDTKGMECLGRGGQPRESNEKGKEMEESAFRSWIESAPKKGRGSVGALADEKEECMVGQRRRDRFSSGEGSPSSLESSDSKRRNKKHKKRHHKEREDGSRKIRKRHHKHRQEHKERKKRRKRESKDNVYAR